MGLFDLFKKKSMGPIDILQMLVQNSKAPRRGTSELLLAYRASPWLHSVVKRIAVEVATAIDFELYDAPAGMPKRQRIYDHPILDLLRSPSPSIPAFSFWQIVQLHKDLVGESFIFIDRNKNGLPATLTPLIPTQVMSTPTKDQPYYTVIPRGGGQAEKKAIEDIIWLADPDPAEPLGRGVGSAECLQDELTADEYAARNIASWFFNDMVPDMIVSLSGADEKYMKQLQEIWKSKYRGPDTKNLPYFTGKNIQVQRLDTSFSEMQLVEIRTYLRDIVHQTLNVPPEIVGITENSNRATSEAAYYILSKGCLYPRIQSIVSELQLKLIPKYKGRLYLGFKNPIPDDRDFQLRCMATVPSAFTQGELRKLAGLDLGETPDERLSSANMENSPQNLPDEPHKKKKLDKS